MAEDEAKAKHDALNKFHHAQVEIDSLTEQLDESESAALDLKNKLSKASAEASTWKTKYEMEGANRIEELEDAK